MPKELKDLSLSEETHVSFDFFLSIGSFTAKQEHDNPEQVGENYSGNIVLHQTKEEHNNGQKKTEEFSSEIRDISLELSLSLPGNYFGLSKRNSHGESSSKKRKRMENVVPRSNITRKASSSKNKKLHVSTNLSLLDPWCIKKALTKSDLNGNSRLLVPLKSLKDYVFPFWNSDQLAKIEHGLPVSVWDADTKTEHELVFKQWNEQANAFKKNWIKDFVKRRNLKLNTVVGLYWDQDTSRFNFSVLGS